MPSLSLSFCPVSVVLFISTAALSIYLQSKTNKTSAAAAAAVEAVEAVEAKSSVEATTKSVLEATTTATTTTTTTATTTTATTTATTNQPVVAFVIGGPGSGKGTQCQLLQERMGWIHLSAGDLLREERNRGGPTADLINDIIAKGQLVPSDVTVRLLHNAMQQQAPKANQKQNVLIDGFPRSQQNVDAWNNHPQLPDVTLVLNFTCPEELLVGRLLERGMTSGRQDDQLDVIRKRFQTFQLESQPIVELYQDKLITIQTDVPVEEVYAKIKPWLQDF
jgi:UMP-CMP kinase